MKKIIESQRWFLIFGIITTITLILSPGLFLNENNSFVLAAPAKQETQYHTYLPAIVHKYPSNSVFGVAIGNDSPGLSQMVEAGLEWTRYFLDWATIEPTEGIRSWSAVSSFESQLQAAAYHHVNIILVVDRTPSWALKQGFSCGAVSTTKFPALKNILSDIVNRYSAAPYNIKLYELWNEEDAAGLLGCWGDMSDTNYYGGGYYGEMLKAVYPTIKTANSQAQVYVGGLLLDCDPRLNLPNKNCTSSKFLEGILHTGASPSFDGISYHGYDYGSNIPGVYGNSNWNSSWNTGPVFITKLAYINSLLAKYGVTGKTIMATETALICDSCGGITAFEENKAYYVTQTYAHSIALGLTANIWYYATGWRNSGFLNGDLSPKPAYHAYKTAYNRLYGAAYSGSADFPGVKGYKFDLGNHMTWVVWSLDGSAHDITLPNTPTSVIDSLGNPVSFSGNTLSITIKPLYIEFQK